MRKDEGLPEGAAGWSERGEWRGAGPGPAGAEPAVAGGAEAGTGPAPRRRQRFTAEEKRALVAEHEQSGLSVERFCTERGLVRAVFTRWRRELGLTSARRGGGARGARAPRRQFTADERRAAVEAFAKSGRTREEFARLWGCSVSSLDNWARRYAALGPKGLEPRPRGKCGPRPAARRVPEAVRAEIVAVQHEHPSFGLRKIRDFLARFREAQVSAGTVRNVLSEHGIAPKPSPARRPRPRVKPPRRFERARAGQLWQTDITSYVLARSGRRVYLTVYLDDASRYVVAWQLASQQRADLVIDPLLEGIARFGKPEEVLSDQGRQYFAWRGKSRFQKLLAREGIGHVVARARHPQTLGKCERLWKTVFEEFWERAKPVDLGDARERFAHWIAHYNHFRPHQGIGGAVPADRFFGAEDARRETLEAGLAARGADELALALEETRRQPVYLFGQIGSDSVSLHGEHGKLVIQTSDGKRRELGLEELGVTATGIQHGDDDHERDRQERGNPGIEPGDGPSQAAAQTHGPQADGVRAPGPTGAGGARAVEPSEPGGARASAPRVLPDARVLAREEVEASGRGGARRGAPAGVAVEPAGGVGHARGTSDAAAAAAQRGADRGDAAGGRSGAAAQGDPGAGDEARADRGLGAGAAHGAVGVGGSAAPERAGRAGRGEGGAPWTTTQADEASEVAGTAPRPADASARSFSAVRTVLGKWRRWRRRWK